jgi:hypothetical protein
MPMKSNFVPESLAKVLGRKTSQYPGFISDEARPFLKSSPQFARKRRPSAIRQQAASAAVNLFSVSRHLCPSQLNRYRSAHSDGGPVPPASGNEAQSAPNDFTHQGQSIRAAKKSEGPRSSRWTPFCNPGLYMTTAQTLKTPAQSDCRVKGCGGSGMSAMGPR